MSGMYCGGHGNPLPCVVCAANLARSMATKELGLNARLTRKIQTEHVFPPIPSRQYDWRATFEGYDPGDSIGTGYTEQEAIDWLIAEEANLIACEHEKARS